MIVAAWWLTNDNLKNFQEVCFQQTCFWSRSILHGYFNPLVFCMKMGISTFTGKEFVICCRVSGWLAMSIHVSDDPKHAFRILGCKQHFLYIQPWGPWTKGNYMKVPTRNRTVPGCVDGGARKWELPFDHPFVPWKIGFYPIFFVLLHTFTIFRGIWRVWMKIWSHQKDPNGGYLPRVL